MSINSAMSAAMSGLAAQSRAIQVVSANVANSMTEGYAPRQLTLSSTLIGGVGGGVRVSGVERQTDAVLVGLLRQGSGATAGTGAQFDFWTQIEQAIGLPGDTYGLTGKVATLETALIAAAARPDLDHRLSAVVDAADDLVEQLNTLEGQVQTLRQNADISIGRDVETLNQGLARVAKLNSDIIKLQASGHPPLGMMDERQTLINTLSDIIPIREFQHPDGRIALYSEGGLLLLDTRPAVFEFTTSPAMDASMSLEDGQLSGLSVNGTQIATKPTGALAGGRLAANFTIRDSDAPAAQSALDQIAHSLASRFEDPATDPTMTAGQPGLFTNLGLSTDPAAIKGLAGRIALNDAVRPEASGALWRLRDGLGAPGAGPVGEAAQLHRWTDALQRPLPGAAGTASRNFADNVGQTISGISQARQAAEDRSGYARAYLGELTQHSLAMGVDVDSEMQRLLLIEKAYAANTRVLQIADELLRQLLEV